MRMLKSKSGKLSFDPSKVGVMVTSIILLVVALKVFATGLPEIGEAGNEISSAGCLYDNGTNPDCDGSATYPLVNLFSSDSVLLLAIVGGVLIAVVLQVLPGKKK